MATDNFIFPDELRKVDDMYKQANRIDFKSEIFSGKLLRELFEQYPIYLNDSYYAQSDAYPRVVRDGDDFKGGFWTELTKWRDCHYYNIMDFNGHRFVIMSGGRYD